MDDTKNKETVERLRALDFNDGEDSNAHLAAIACAIVGLPFWTVDACEELRTVLIEMLEGANRR